VNCEACRGACCESFYIPIADVRLPSNDARRWFELHGRASDGQLEIEARCTALTREGRCAIYKDRPDMCWMFEPGGPDCLDTVRRRRTPDQYAVIRGPEDPPTIHG